MINKTWLAFMVSLLLLSCTFEQASEPENEFTENSIETDTATVLEARWIEDDSAYAALSAYNGTYDLITESEGVDCKLRMNYLGDKRFKTELKLAVPQICNATIEGEVLMDRTQHGFYNTDSCFLHVNFLGIYGNTVSIEIEQVEDCPLIKGDCIVSGTYTRMLE
jgi:hypothetical protein